MPLIAIILVLLLSGCRPHTSELSPIVKQIDIHPIEEDNFIDPNGMTIEARILLPKGYKRIGVASASYAQYLRRLPLKPDGAMVKLYNGQPKSNQQAHVAVVDLEIGRKNLHQCADAIMRLKADYLWKNEKYHDIHFNLTNGFQVDYSEWMKGRRVIVVGNRTSWNNKNQPSNTYKDFWAYLEFVFTYAGTLSLEKEMNRVAIEELSIGDVFIQGGSPGHAVIVVDIGINPDSEKKIFLLAQSYMPAQEIHILNNPNGSTGPWYTVDQGSQLLTPEWKFLWTNLKRFN
jgi:hypothetical protein